MLQQFQIENGIAVEYPQVILKRIYVCVRSLLHITESVFIDTLFELEIGKIFVKSVAL